MTVIERATIWAEYNDDIQRRLERAVMVIRQHKHIITEVYENAEQVAKWETIASATSLGPTTTNLPRITARMTPGFAS